MLKPASLRDALVAALPQLQQSPRNIRFTIQRGRVVNTGTPSLSWEYRYTLSLVIADFTGSIDANGNFSYTNTTNGNTIIMTGGETSNGSRLFSRLPDDLLKFQFAGFDQTARIDLRR